MPINIRPFYTSAFRLIAIYLLFFALSISAVLGYIYLRTVNLLEQQNEETIKAEASGLADQYRTGGLVALKGAIDRRLQTKTGMLVMLADPSGNFLAGNLRSLQINDLPDDSWVDLTLHLDDQKEAPAHQVRAYNLQLPEDFQMIVGLDVEDLAQFSQVVRRAFYWGLGIAACLGVFGGLAASRNLLQRVDAITKASRVIMQGDFSGRMPITGVDDELDRLSQSLNEMLSQIERLMQGMREVSSNVAHDLRTPLTRLRARIEAALRQKTKEAYRTALQQTLAESDALLATFNALLSINQLESGQLRNALVNLDAHEVLEDVVDLYAPLAEENQGTLRLKASAGLLVRGKRELMAQAVINLIDNAMKYGGGPDGAANIMVEGRRDGAEVVISVSDGGPGIPAKDRERVLERFVRLDESRSKPGNGLGLSLASSVANLLNGKLILHDNQPGLRAELRLPLAAGAG